MMTDDRIFDIPMYSPVCTFCGFYDPAKHRECRAFPEGKIPLEIWLGEDKHTETHPDQSDSSILFIENKK